MARRLSIAALALLAAPAFAGEPDRACTRETIGRTPAVTALQAALDSIFDRAAAPSVETESGVTAELTSMEVLVVRVKDGKPVIACVDSKEAAERFLAAPISQIGGKAAEEK